MPAPKRAALLFLLSACSACSERPTNYQAVQAEVERQRNEANNGIVECNDCGPPVIDANGQVIPQG